MPESLSVSLHSICEEHINDDVVPSYSRASKIAQGPPQNRVLGRGFGTKVDQGYYSLSLNCCKGESEGGKGSPKDELQSLAILIEEDNNAHSDFPSSVAK